MNPAILKRRVIDWYSGGASDANIDFPLTAEAQKVQWWNGLHRTWSDPTAIMRKLYDNLSAVMTGPSVAAAVLIIAEYQYKSAFAVDQEINLLACMTQLMLECEFKWLSKSSPTGIMFSGVLLQLL